MELGELIFQGAFLICCCLGYACWGTTHRTSSWVKAAVIGNTSTGLPCNVQRDMRSSKAGGEPRCTWFTVTVSAQLHLSSKTSQ